MRRVLPIALFLSLPMAGATAWILWDQLAAGAQQEDAEKAECSQSGALPPSTTPTHKPERPYRHPNFMTVVRQWKERAKVAERQAQNQGEEFLEEAPDYFDMLLAKQPRNEVWERRVMTDGERLLLQSGNEGTQIDAVVCGGTYCKILFRHENDAALEKFQRDAVDKGPWEGTQLGGFEEDGSGVPKTYIYFFGKGASLPMEEYAGYKEQAGAR